MKSRITTVRFALVEHNRLAALASRLGISLGELIRRIASAHDDFPSGSPNTAPSFGLDANPLAAEFHALEIRVESLSLFVQAKVRDHERLVASLAEQASAMSTLVAAIHEQTLTIEHLTETLRDLAQHPQSSAHLRPTKFCNP